MNLYNIIPKLHISTYKLYPFSLFLEDYSGAIYYLVPHSVCAFLFTFNLVDNPKSPNFIYILLSINTFVNLISLCIIDKLCK